MGEWNLKTEEKKPLFTADTQKMQDDILEYICSDIRTILKKAIIKKGYGFEEIRMRAGKPLLVEDYSGSSYVTRQGCLSKSPVDCLIVTQDQIMRTLSLMSENSVYAYQDEIKNGFITLKGGHRVGIAGKAVMDGQAVKNIKDVSSLNIRISKEIKGCSDTVINFIHNEKCGVFNTLIISPPQCGKTTMLRDIALKLSNGEPQYGITGIKVGIIDERSEIAACYKGIPQYDVGIRTDVLDSCPKTVGMLMMLRSMSPRVIITDEIGNKGDRDAILQVLNAGIKVITSVHGYDMSELKCRKEIRDILEEKIFERLVILDNSKGPGTVRKIMDGLTMEVLFENDA